jgi:hypothetical protein
VAKVVVPSQDFTGLLARYDLRPLGVRPYFKIMQIEKLPSTVFTLLENGAGVLLNLSTLCYYSLNKTGVAVWKVLEENNAVAIEDITKTVCERFEVTKDAAQIDLRAFVEHLARFNMVEIH